MMPIIDDLPAYSSAATRIKADEYNAVRLALRRLSDNLHIAIRGHEHLEIIIDNDSWVVIDHNQNDYPIAAWTDFETEGRGLHEAMRCQLHYYHFGAAVVVKEAKAALERYLGIKLPRESKKATVKSNTPTAIK